jgi:hypothetical protein
VFISKTLLSDITFSGVFLEVLEDGLVLIASNGNGGRGFFFRGSDIISAVGSGSFLLCFV